MSDNFQLEVIQVLNLSLHWDANLRLPAEQKLIYWETQPGFISCLINIILNKSLDPSTRIAAAICLKNTIIRVWKPRNHVHIVGEEEKNFSKRNLLSFVDEDPKLSVQVSLIISIIARSDFPQEWPDLIQTILQTIQNGSSLQVQRALLTLHHVVKVLASKRLLPSRNEFQQLSQALFSSISSIWLSSTNNLLTVLSSYSNNQISSQELQKYSSVGEVCKYSVKILRRFIVNGLPKFNETQSAIQFFQNLLQKLETWVICKNSVPSNSLSPYVDELLRIQSKLVVEVQDTFSVPFISFLGPYLQFFFTRIMKNDIQSDRFIINCMTFLKNVSECSKYRTDEKVIDENIKQANNILDAVFTKENVLNICKVLICTYFPISKEELQTWASDPETYFNDDEMDSTEERVKSCAKSLFTGLLTTFQWLPEIIVPIIHQILKDSNSYPNPILIKDACYVAVGLGYYNLSEYIDFSSWLLNSLVPEIQNNDPSYKIIRRRIAWLCGSWVANIKEELRGNLYGILLTLISGDDLVVSLTAAKALKNLVDDVLFHVNSFLDFIAPSVNLLFQLLNRVQECDTKMRVLDVLSILIQRLDEKILPFSSRIVQHFQQLWQITDPKETFNLLRQSIVIATTKLMDVFANSNTNAEQSTILYSFVIPLIRYSTDVKIPHTVYLLEDGLTLWESTINQTPQMSQELLDIFPHIPTIIELSLENTRIIMNIVDQYLVLGKGEFLKAYIQPLIHIFNLVVANAKDQAIVWTLKPMETLLILFPQQAPNALAPVLQKIFVLIITSGEEADLIIPHYINIFARILFQNPHFFESFISTLAQLEQKSDLLITFLEIWLQKTDNMGTRMRKLSCLALLNLFPTSDINILQYASPILSLCVSVIHSEKDSEQTQVSFEEGDVLLGTVPTSKQKIVDEDILSTTQFHPYLMDKMKQIEQIQGPNNFQQFLNSLDESVLKQLQGLNNLNTNNNNET